jgi:hypothetical protein
LCGKQTSSPLIVTGDSSLFDSLETKLSKIRTAIIVELINKRIAIK